MKLERMIKVQKEIQRHINILTLFKLEKYGQKKIHWSKKCSTAFRKQSVKDCSLPLSMQELEVHIIGFGGYMLEINLR